MATEVHVLASLLLFQQFISSRKFLADCVGAGAGAQIGSSIDTLQG